MKKKVTNQLSFLGFVDAPAADKLRHASPEGEPELPVICATCGLKIKADVWYITYVHDPQGGKHHYWCRWPGLPTQWQVLDLCRIWLSPRLQKGGDLAHAGLLPGFYDRKGVFRPTVASWAIGEVFSRIQKDWIGLWPPVYPDQPYHVRLVVSYHDPEFHKGILYREMGWQPMYTDIDGKPRPGPSGKFGWCWSLPEPAWSWNQIEISKPRTMRLPLC